MDYNQARAIPSKPAEPPKFAGGPGDMTPDVPRLVHDGPRTSRERSAASKEGWRVRKRMAAVKQLNKEKFTVKPICYAAFAVLGSALIYASHGQAQVATPAPFVATGNAASAPSDGKIDFNQLILDVKGQPSPYCDDGSTTCAHPVNTTLRILAVNALSAVYNDEPSLTGDQRMKRGLLAIKIENATGPIALSPEDLTLLKQLIGKAFNPISIARAWPMLDPTLK